MIEDKRAKFNDFGICANFGVKINLLTEFPYSMTTHSHLHVTLYIIFSLFAYILSTLYLIKLVKHFFYLLATGFCCDELRFSYDTHL